ncbi:MAG: hypothetical protein WAV24_06745, partial [Methanothrix sp.]|uniref:hypothetical protein n=1 Tax=Methanothrix sp. TaxID=90426 RepID=UPI003BAEDFC9
PERSIPGQWGRPYELLSSSSLQENAARSIKAQLASLTEIISAPSNFCFYLNGREREGSRWCSEPSIADILSASIRI